MSPARLPPPGPVRWGASVIWRTFSDSEGRVMV